MFAAFASAEAKSTWGDTGDLEPAGGQAGVTEFGFQAGGRERFGFETHGTTYRYDARYYDIVPDQRIITPTRCTRVTLESRCRPPRLNSPRTRTAPR